MVRIYISSCSSSVRSAEHLKRHLITSYMANNYDTAISKLLLLQVIAEIQSSKLLFYGVNYFDTMR